MANEAFERLPLTARSCVKNHSLVSSEVEINPYVRNSYNHIRDLIWVREFTDSVVVETKAVKINARREDVYCVHNCYYGLYKRFSHSYGISHSSHNKEALWLTSGAGKILILAVRKTISDIIILDLMLFYLRYVYYVNI